MLGETPVEPAGKALIMKSKVSVLFHKKHIELRPTMEKEGGSAGLRFVRQRGRPRFDATSLHTKHAPRITEKRLSLNQV